MKAKSITGKSFEEIQAALGKAIADDFFPTLAIVFISVMQDRKAIAEMFHQKGIDIFGATSCGEFVDDHHSEGGIAILLLSIPRESYAILFNDMGDGTIEQLADQIGQRALQTFKDPSMIVCSTGMNTKGEFFDGESFVKHIGKAIGPERIFFGGMAGDDWMFTGTYVFTYGLETPIGAVTLVLDAQKISLAGIATTGWKPLGISRKVTKSIDNRLYMIDGKPAVEMYLKYLGKEERKDDKEFNVFEELGFTYPFITEREPGGETVLRSPLKIDHKEKALELDIAMPEGTTFWFSTPPDFDIVDEILDEATHLKKADAMGADALLIFSCAGRPPVLGPLVNAENNGLANVWQTPMAGFFTYGEYGRTKKGKQEYHSGACCWVALKEK
jgi:hypothetical protein